MERFSPYEQIDISVDSTCLQSDPCQHWVTKRGENSCSLWSGDKICKYYQEKGFEVPPHFREYIKREINSPSFHAVYKTYPKPPSQNQCSGNLNPAQLL